MGKMKDQFFDDEYKDEPEYEFIANLSDEDIAFEMDIADVYIDEETQNGAMEIPEFETGVDQNKLNDEKYIVDIPKKPKYPFAFKEFYSYKTREQRFYEDGLKYQDEIGEKCEQVPLVTYFPSYDTLTISQLRWYFYWRNEFRKGNIIETSLSYFFLYAYELINLIGCKDKEEALNALIQIFKYTKNHLDFSIKHFANWIKDFVIFYDCEFDYQAIIFDIVGDNVGEFFPLETLTNFLDKGETAGLINALNIYSDYDVLRSKFFLDGNIPVFLECTKNVLLAFESHYLKKNKLDFIQKWNKSDNKHRYFPFEFAIFFTQDEIRIENPRVINKYISFWRESNHIMTSMQNNLLYNLRWRKFVTGLLRCIDANLRTIANFKWKIRSVPLSKNQLEIAEKAIREHFKDYQFVPSEKSKVQRKEKEKIQEKPKIEFTVDFGKIDDLHSVSNEIRDKLILEQGLAEEICESPQVPDEMVNALQNNDNTSPLNDEWSNLSMSLSAMQKEVLRVIYHKENINPSLSEIESRAHVFMDVLIDEINEKAFDCIGDSIIDMNEEEPFIFEDYVLEIGGMING